LFWAFWKNTAKTDFDQVVAFMLWSTIAQSFCSKLFEVKLEFIGQLKRPDNYLIKVGVKTVNLPSSYLTDFTHKIQ